MKRPFPTTDRPPMKISTCLAAALLLCLPLAGSASRADQDGAYAVGTESLIEARAPAGDPYAVITIPQKLFDSLQLDFGLTKAQAAGIVGNLAHESGNFTMLQEIGGGCYGYSQWCGVRKTEFLVYAASAGGQQSFDANYGFLKHELQTEYASMLRRIRNTTTVDASAKIFMKEFLRPAPATANLNRRINFGKKFFNADYTGAGCYSHPRLMATNRPAPCPGDTL